MHIPDPIERGEARAESWYFDNVKDGKFYCDACKEWIELSHGVMMSADPYCPPSCPKCSGVEEYLDSQEKQ